jgi:hypothetical protein
MSILLRNNKKVIQIADYSIWVDDILAVCVSPFARDSIVVSLAGGNKLLIYLPFVSQEVLYIKLTEMVPNSMIVPYYRNDGVYSSYLITPPFISAFRLNKSPMFTTYITGTTQEPPPWCIQVFTSCGADVTFDIPISGQDLQKIYETYESILFNFMEKRLGLVQSDIQM